MLFLFEEERLLDSVFVEKIWSTRSEQAKDFTSLAAIHSGIVVSRYEGKTTITVRGPETRATAASTPANAEFWGIDFKPGTFMPSLLPRHLMDRRDADLPAASSKTFWLDSAVWEIPRFDNADLFIKRLVREGLLAHDPVVAAVLQGQPQDFSPRALQYRFVRATGLSHKAIRQIERAQQALALLQHGTSITDTAYTLGYFDQSHLTNSLKRFVGQTPSQIVSLHQPE